MGDPVAWAWWDFNAEVMPVLRRPRSEDSQRGTGWE